MKITDEYTVELGRYCSERIGKQIYIGGSHAMITFRTDGRNNEKGFLMVFAAAKPGNVSCNNNNKNPKINGSCQNQTVLFKE